MARREATIAPREVVSRSYYDTGLAGCARQSICMNTGWVVETLLAGLQGENAGLRQVNEMNVVAKFCFLNFEFLHARRLDFTSH
jgi:hypothetical protein